MAYYYGLWVVWGVLSVGFITPSDGLKEYSSLDEYVESSAVQATSYVGLQNLIKYYKSHRFDPDIGLPKWVADFLKFESD